MNKVTLVSYSVKRIMIMIVNIYGSFCGIVDFLLELCVTYNLLNLLEKIALLTSVGSQYQVLEAPTNFSVTF